jgi:hypothetical protein
MYSPSNTSLGSISDAVKFFNKMENNVSLSGGLIGVLLFVLLQIA